MANWFVSTAGWNAVTAWAATTAYSIGDIRRQTAPTSPNHRVFRCTTAGTSGGSEPAWNLTKGSTTNDGTCVWTEITGNSTYNTTSFAAPHYWLHHAAGSGWSAAGDTIYVDDDHDETQAATRDIVATGTAASPTRIIAITSTFSNPPVAADVKDAIPATLPRVATSGANYMLFGSDGLYINGIRFVGGSSGSSPLYINYNTDGHIIFEKCAIVHGYTGGGTLQMASGASSAGASDTIEFINCDIGFSAASSGIQIRGGNVIWRGGTLTGTKVTQLIGISGGVACYAGSRMTIADVDLSLQSTSAYLVNVASANIQAGGLYRFNNCLLSDTLAGVTTGTFGAGNARVELITSDDTSNAAYRTHVQTYAGTLLSDDTYERTGGASDGTDAIAWRVDTTANASYFYPFYCPDIYQWVDSTGSKTFSIYIANNSSFTCDEADIGFELEFMGSATTPVGTHSTTRPNILSTGSTNWTTDTSTWAGTTTTKQVMSVTKTINHKGWVRARVYVQKASFTCWIDPLLVVT